MATYAQLQDTRTTARKSAQATRDAAFLLATTVEATREQTLADALKAADAALVSGLAANATAVVTAQRAALVPLFAASIASGHAATDALAYGAACVSADSTSKTQNDFGIGRRVVSAAAEAIIALDSQAAPGIAAALLDGVGGDYFVLLARNALQAFASGNAVLAIAACREIEAALRTAGQRNRGTLTDATRLNAFLAQAQT